MWSEEKLHQLLNQRYNNGLPTVITSSLTPDEFATNHPNIWNRILDTEVSNTCIINMPPYRRIEKQKKTTSKKRK
jgi:DNA replication protein DnaC